MAHSRIFEVSWEPLPESDWVGADEFTENGFVGSVADYTVGINEEERHKSVERLNKHVLGTLEIVPEGSNYKLTLLPNGKEEYFGHRLNSLKSLIYNMSIEEFCRDVVAFQMQEEINKRHSFYIYSDGYYQTLDNFIRDLNEGEVYYICGVIDYHM